MIWPYSIETIPSGWHLCDGTAGTVDYRNCFIVCAGDIYAPGDTALTNVVTDTGMPYKAGCFIQKLPIP